MTVRFTKMHALGNDFMVIDGIHQSIAFTQAEIRSLAQRHTGVGFDQCLIVESSQHPDIDFFYRIYNADGTEVGQCGNGARCLARFIERYEFSHKKTITVATRTTHMSLHLNDDQTVTIELERPQWKGNPLPPLEHIELDQRDYAFYEIDVGNPHAVLLATDVRHAPVQAIGQQLSTHPFFPQQCNIGFMQILNPTHIHCRVYERGCGETQACGSGAVAAAAIGKLVHGLSDNVTVTLPGGDLFVHWPDQSSSIFLTGDATFVYDGVLIS